MTLRLENVRCGYGRKVVVEGFSASISSGQVFCLLGPNGIGKTTLFKTMLGVLPLMGGAITCDGRNTSELSIREYAKLIAYVPQAHTPPFDYKVFDVVAMGRTAHAGVFGRPGKNDLAVAGQMLQRLGIAELGQRVYTQLSGGERQMVLIARALAQEPAFLMMDEPTNNLDFGNQVRVLQNVNKLAREGLGIIMTTHFPDHVFQCHADVALMKRDSTYVCGACDEVLTEENLHDAYGIDVAVFSHRHHAHDLHVCQPIMTSADGPAL